MYGLPTSHQAWSALAERFASQSRSHISYLKRQLQNLQQGNKSCTKYIRLAKQWADQLAAAGKPVEEDDLISFIVSGLNSTFNPFVTAFSFAIRTTNMTFADLQSELLSHEMMLENQHQSTLAPETGSFALYTNKSNSSFSFANRKPRFPPKNHSRFSTPSSRFSGPPSRFSNTSPKPPTAVQDFSRNPASRQRPMLNNHQGLPAPCQICGKFNHSALDCYHMMDYAYQGRHPPPQLAAMIAHNNAEFESHEWLADSGANTHVAADPSALNNPQPFEGNETVGVGNGAGLEIQSIGSSLVQSTSPSKFLLNDILYCPSSSANLLSINKFCIDNHCSFELTGSHFAVKDNLTGTVLL
jgi:hypothetical protein